MQAFTVSTGVAAPVIRDNIDTDMLIRIERLAQLKRGQFGPWLFEMWRYLDDGRPDPDFILNQPPFDGATFIVAGRNFGCGSSREMAVWALQEFGIRCVMAESFGDIFYTNCFQNGVLPIVLEREQLQAISHVARQGQPLTVDLQNTVITSALLPAIPFSVPQAHRSALLLGQDEIAQTQMYESEIAAFQARDHALRPWVYLPA